MSRVITVFGAKGGLGKTTVAANLAIKLAEYRKKVALIDLDLQFGDIQLFMDKAGVERFITDHECFGNTNKSKGKHKDSNGEKQFNGGSLCWGHSGRL
jgi:cellulose biosynthesis protein BcsQ